MGMCIIAVGQLLSEEDIVVRPDGIEIYLRSCYTFHGNRFFMTAFVLVLWDRTCGKAEVTVGEAVLDILDAVIARRTERSIFGIVFL